MQKRWGRTHIAGWSSRVIQQPDSSFIVSAIDWRGEVITRAKMGLRDLEEAKRQADDLLRVHHPHTCGAQCTEWQRPGERVTPSPELDLTPEIPRWVSEKAWTRT